MIWLMCNISLLVIMISSDTRCICTVCICRRISTLSMIWGKQNQSVICHSSSAILSIQFISFSYILKSFIGYNIVFSVLMIWNFFSFDLQWRWQVWFFSVIYVHVNGCSICSAVWEVSWCIWWRRSRCSRHA